MPSRSCLTIFFYQLSARKATTTCIYILLVNVGWIVQYIFTLFWTRCIIAEMHLVFKELMVFLGGACIALSAMNLVLQSTWYLMSAACRPLGIPAILTLTFSASTSFPLSHASVIVSLRPLHPTVSPCLQNINSMPSTWVSGIFHNITLIVKGKDSAEELWTLNPLIFLLFGLLLDVLDKILYRKAFCMFFLMIILVLAMCKDSKIFDALTAPSLFV